MSSSIYSVAQIGLSQFFLSKFLWFLVLITCLFGSFYKIQKFCHAYLQYPVNINLQVDQSKSLEFPAVTICNLNRLLQEYDGRTDLGVPLVLSESNSLYSCEKTTNVSHTSDKNKDMKWQFLQEYYGMSETKRSKRGHKPLYYVTECSFKGQKCDKTHLTFFYNWQFGNCVTFNKNNSLRISEIGFGSGLTLMLDLESDYYLDTTHTVGAKVVIQDSDEIQVQKMMDSSSVLDSRLQSLSSRLFIYDFQVRTKTNVWITNLKQVIP
ncbi:acid-sensing ion channel 1 [Caerostris extrusa]|uniref:Acid-sensing ion channel 1 n=1 Tax=Caerostris extrusa TaxID=172846 RepID=A0AAV4SQ16_CAEEX|nr:acid-sensing ion channel 1 [Caerostris extrusa]